MPVLNEPEWAAHIARGCPWLGQPEHMTWVEARTQTWRLDTAHRRLFFAGTVAELRRWEHTARVLAFDDAHTYRPLADPGSIVVAVHRPCADFNIDLLVLAELRRATVPWLPHVQASTVDAEGCGIGRSRLPLCSEGWHGGIEGVRRPLGLTFRLFDGLRRSDMRDRHWTLDGRRVRYGSPGSNDLRHSLELRSIRPQLSAALHPSDDGTCVSAYGDGRVGWALYVFAEHMRVQPAGGP